MTGSGDCELEIVSRFRSRLIEDLLGEGARPLADYLEDVPRPHRALAARGWMEMTGEGVLPIPATVEEGSEEAGDFGPYRLIRELGRGGQGSVHLAEDLRLGRQVALKVLEGWASSSQVAIRRLRREAEVASKVDDPGICTVYETGVESGTPFIAMRYVEGQSLAQRIAAARKAGAPAAVEIATADVGGADGGSDEESSSESSGSTSRQGRAAVLEVVALIEKVARSLHAAHEAGILHRDIKPGNIMVTPSGDPVITDFGIARQRDSEQPTLTRSGDIVGTPAYMSPEQLGGRAHELDRRSDAWALGVTLYECLTLQRPFAAPTREGLYLAIEGHEPPDPRKLNRAIPEDLRVVLDVALEKECDRRYQTALDFAEELRRVRQSEPIHARRAGPMLRLARWARRQPAVAASLSALFLVLIAGMAVSLFLKAEADRNLHSWRRMADVRLLDDLLREADEELWPAFPEKIAAMEAWLERADDLLGRRDRHDATLAGLRAAARPYTEIDRARDRREHPLAEALLGAQHRLEHLRGEIERSVARVGELAREIRDLEDEGGARARRQLVRTEHRHDALLEEIELLRRERRSLIEKTAAWSEEIASARSWSFDESEDAYRHEVLLGLLAGLETLGRPETGLRASVARRLERAQGVWSVSVEAHDENWRETCRAVQASPVYGGLALTPQTGLVPLGPDPHSGLFEFADVQTGEIPERDPASGRLRISETTGLVFVLLPGGTFHMGAVSVAPDGATSGPNVDRHAYRNEGPVHAVTLAPFFISKFEMTQGQWERCTGSNPAATPPGTAYGKRITTLMDPVSNVSWRECERMTRRLGMLLPTEARWEYACRGGTSSMWWVGDDEAALKDVANVRDAFFAREAPFPVPEYGSWDDGYLAAAPVGSFRANPFGLHDVHGNVWEWCRDRIGAYTLPLRPGDGFREVFTDGTPLPQDTEGRVIRGGSFDSPPRYTRSASRSGAAVRGGDEFLGLRPSRAIESSGRPESR